MGLPPPRARSRLAGAFLALICLLAAPVVARDSRALVETRESLYNKIYIYKEGTRVFMTFGLNRELFIESAANTTDELELPAPYTRFMTAGLAYAKETASVLEIGSGGARTSWYLHRSLPESSVTTVELDPVVVELSRKYFGIRDEGNFKTVNEDGRQFLMRTDQHYDLILLDAYHGPFVPFHLLTTEFYTVVKQHLAQGGVVVQNLDPSSALFDSIVKTARGVFAQSDLFLSAEDGRLENAVLIAYDGEPRSREELAKLADARQAALRLRYPLPELMKDRRPIERGDKTIDWSAKLLTDDFAPVEALKAIDRHNRQFPSQTPAR
jgi:spermidine synthase